jgi:hypothetical protein
MLSSPPLPTPVPGAPPIPLPEVSLKSVVPSVARTLGLLTLGTFNERQGGLQRSLMGHLNRSIDGVFEIVRVVGRSFVSIAEVHAIFARAQQAQREPEVARNRFRFRERHGLVK